MNFDLASAEVAFCNVYYQCLRDIDKRTGLTSVSFPAIATDSDGIEPWTAIHATIKAVVQFDEDTAASPGDLRTISFVNLSLSVADTMTVVYRQVLQNESDATTPTSETTSQVQLREPANLNDQSNDQSDWYAISGILKHQKRRGKDWYLVSWQGLYLVLFARANWASRL